MGAKAGILALADGDIAAALKRQPHADAERTRALVEAIFPGYSVQPTASWPLAESTYPEDEVVCALSAADLDILCDQRFVLDKPSELPGHVLEVAAGRRVVLCGMNSTDDSFAYALWTKGQLGRSLSLSLPGGIVEDIGEPLEFESSFWSERQAGSGGLTGAPGFHPLDLAEQAMRFLFGFTLDGRPAADDVDASRITTLSYRVTDPTGAEQAARMAASEEFMQRTRRRRYVLGPDGSLVRVDGDSGPG